MVFYFGAAKVRKYTVGQFNNREMKIKKLAANQSAFIIKKALKELGRQVLYLRIYSSLWCNKVKEPT